MDTQSTPAEVLASDMLPETNALIGKSLSRRIADFGKEVWNDHDLMIRAYALRGGITAVVIAAVLVAFYAVASPVLAASAIIAVGGCLTALGLTTVLIGGAAAWSSLKEIYSKTISGKPVKPVTAAKKSLYQKFLEKPGIRHLGEKPLVKKFLNSWAWQKASMLAQKQQKMIQEAFLTTMAGGSSLFLGTLSIVTLITQISLLPVVAIGGLYVLTTAVAVGGIVSSGYAVYLSAQKALHALKSFRLNRKNKAAEPKIQDGAVASPQEIAAMEASTPLSAAPAPGAVFSKVAMSAEQAQEIAAEKVEENIKSVLALKPPKAKGF